MTEIFNGGMRNKISSAATGFVQFGGMQNSFKNRKSHVTIGTRRTATPTGWDWAKQSEWDGKWLRDAGF